VRVEKMSALLLFLSMSGQGAAAVAAALVAHST
jgi:hypothetical protein